jgi:nitrile hydratase
MSTASHDHDHDHDHDGHGHNHADSAVMSGRVKNLIARLEQRGVLTEENVDTYVDKYLSEAQPVNGFRVVARAWVDPAFKERLLADATTAVGELGFDITRGSPIKLRAVANTPERHNVIVCTLCSCYPMSLLGVPPKWYKSEAYRSRTVRNPREVLGEFGVQLPADTEVRVWDSTSEVRYMVVPQRPAGTEGKTEAELAQLVTRNALIGTALL